MTLPPSAHHVVVSLLAFCRFIDTPKEILELVGERLRDICDWMKTTREDSFLAVKAVLEQYPDHEGEAFDAALAAAHRGVSTDDRRCVARHSGLSAFVLP